jgi:hypothetical protein
MIPSSRDEPRQRRWRAGGRWERCLVRAECAPDGGWRARCRFWADAIGPAGPYRAGESPAFAEGRDHDPVGEHAASWAALEGLVVRLRADGWAPFRGGGTPWYAHRFRRRLGDPAAPAAGPVAPGD